LTILTLALAVVTSLTPHRLAADDQAAVPPTAASDEPFDHPFCRQSYVSPGPRCAKLIADNGLVSGEKGGGNFLPIVPGKDRQIGPQPGSTAPGGFLSPITV